ncbi:MAG: ferritin-like domain-containing protein [Bacillota bacterium]
MIKKGTSLKPIIDIESLGFDSGAHLLVKQGLSQIAAGEEIEIVGRALEWQTQASAWCRIQGHELRITEDKTFIRKRSSEMQRWDTTIPMNNEVLSEPAASLGLAARGAQVEIGSPEFHFKLNKKEDVWSSNAAELYQQALSAQWNANTAIDWSQPKEHSDLLENAVVQLMTYMVENENAALILPARFLGQLHPHFREVQAVLSIQIADEARHIDVFNRRIQLYGKSPALSTAGGQASLKTLLDESDFGVAEFLLAVLGEGTFVDLLQFLHRFGPDPATKQIALLAAKDESRHVSFGMSHLLDKVQKDPEFKYQLKKAVQDRFEGLRSTSGLNEEVFDSLIVLAAGDLTPSNISEGFKEVQKLLNEMKEGRRVRLQRLGFSNAEASEMSSLHTRNFM